MIIDPSTIFNNDLKDSSAVFCVFLSGPHQVYNSDASAVITNMIYVPCLQNYCKYWTHVDTSTDLCVIQLIQKIPEIIINSYETAGVLDQHIHNAHYHSKPHLASNIYAGLGPKVKKATGESTSLLAEYSAGEDLDDNGYVYGKDFYIDTTDPDCPRMIQQIEIPEGNTLPVISWADYLGSSSPFGIGE